MKLRRLFAAILLISLCFGTVSGADLSRLPHDITEAVPLWEIEQGAVRLLAGENDLFAFDGSTLSVYDIKSGGLNESYAPDLPDGAQLLCELEGGWLFAFGGELFALDSNGQLTKAAFSADILAASVAESQINLALSDGTMRVLSTVDLSENATLIYAKAPVSAACFAPGRLVYLSEGSLFIADAEGALFSSFAVDNEAVLLVAKSGFVLLAHSVGETTLLQLYDETGVLLSEATLTSTVNSAAIGGSEGFCAYIASGKRLYRAEYAQDALSLSVVYSIPEEITCVAALRDMLVVSSETHIHALVSLGVQLKLEIDELGEITAEHADRLAELRLRLESLTPEQRALVSNEAALAKAEAELKKLLAPKEEAGGVTHRANIVQKVSYELDENIKAVNELISNLSETPTAERVYAAFSAYAALSDEQRLFVTDYTVLQSHLSEVGKANHTVGGLTLNGAADTIVLHAEALNANASAYAALQESSGEGRLLGAWHITLSEALTGEAYATSEPLYLDFDESLANGNENYLAAMISPDGGLRYIDLGEQGALYGGSGDYALIGYDGASPAALSNESEKKPNAPLLYAAAGFGLLGLGALLAKLLSGKRR